MSTSTRVTFDQYEAMVRRGDFEPREANRVELIHGEVVPMSPISPPHDNAISELNEWSFDVSPRDAVRVRVQGSVGIPALDSVPQPDVVWLRRQDYSRQHPRPDDVLLLIEVADSSLAYDRTVKAALYAEAGIRDYWVVNIPDRRVEVHRDPAGKAYRSVEAFGPGRDVRPLEFPGAALPVDRVFPS